MGRFRNRLDGAAGALLFAAALLVATSATSAAAQTAQRIHGSIVVVDPATLSQDAALGARPIPLPAPRPGAAPPQETAGDVSSARYVVGGLGGDSFSVEVPAVVSLTRAGSGETIDMTLVPSQTAGQVAGPPGAPGETAIEVGGRLPMSAATRAGLYVGEVGVTVAYH